MAFPPDTTYATKAELKERIAVEAANTASDTMLQQLLNDAAWVVDAMTRGARESYEAFSASASEARYFSDDGGGLIFIDDAVTITQILRGTTEVTSDYYKLLPLNRLNGPATKIALRSDAPVASTSVWDGWPYAGLGLGQITVTGTWGYCTSAHRPSVVKEATLRIAALSFELNGVSVDSLVQMMQSDPTRFLSKPVWDRLAVLRADRAVSIV